MSKILDANSNIVKYTGKTKLFITKCIFILEDANVPHKVHIKACFIILVQNSPIDSGEGVATCFKI